MILMHKNGAYMNCYNPNEVKQAEAKGWEVVPETPVKKTRKKRAKK